MADTELERDLAHLRISRAIRALEAGRPEDALTILKSERLCEYGRCASLTAAHRLLERWVYRARGIEVKDPLVEYDTESFLGHDIFKLRCPRCDEPLQLACPMSRCEEPPPPEKRVTEYLNRYAAGVAPMMFSCAGCESALCIACPFCGRGPIDKWQEKEKS
jgi:hypothetical protein